MDPRSELLWSRRATWVSACAGIVSLVFLAFFNPFSVGAEDAVILHQFSRNLATTGVITYIPGGERAEGATDFLWMIYLAAAMKLHVSPGTASAFADVFLAIPMAWAVLCVAARKAGVVSILVIVGLLAFFPQFQASLKGFSVIPFGLGIALTFYCATSGKDYLGALAALYLCLLRPDGVVFAVPILVLVRLYRNPRWSHAGVVYAALFVLPGLIYFFWRWHYFHHFLPLPFMVKSDTHRILGLIVASSAQALWRYVLFSTVLLGGVLGRSALQGRTARAIVALLVLPTLFYGYMRLDQNLNDRFFFYIPLGLTLLCAPVWGLRWAFPRRYVVGSAVLLWLVFFAVPTGRALLSNILYRQEWARLAAMGASLNRPELRGTMLVTEAGILPYYSHWTPYDPWGLNSAEYARHLMRPDEVVALHPDLIILHGIGTDCAIETFPVKTARSWDNLIDNLRTGVAELPGYTAYRVPYWGPAKQARMNRDEHGRRDDLCWYVSPTYRAKQQIGLVLLQYGGEPLASLSRP